MNPLVQKKWQVVKKFRFVSTQLRLVPNKIQACTTRTPKVVSFRYPFKFHHLIAYVAQKIPSMFSVKGQDRNAIKINVPKKKYQDLSN